MGQTIGVASALTASTPYPLEIVYFSSVSENTKRFVDKLGLTAHRIPLASDEASAFTIALPSVLVIPTYGGGNEASSVPKQVIKFLNNPDNRSLIKGVIGGGNTNFGVHFCMAAEIVASKLGVPIIYRFEITGTPEDVLEVKRRLEVI